MAGAAGTVRRALPGRTQVVESIWRDLQSGTGVVVEGPAGIGKSAVVAELRRVAADAGWSVLWCAPTRAESDLPLAALADLLQPLIGHLPRLPAQQRTAADAIFQTGPAETPGGGRGGVTPEAAVDERALGGATRSLLLEALGGPTPVLVVIDDVGWLDRASAAALEFALRRLEVAVLVSTRTESALDAQPGTQPGTQPAAPSEGGSSVPLGLEQASHIRLRHVQLPALSAVDLQALLAEAFGRDLPKPLTARIAGEAHGNPLVAIELARAALRAPRLPRPTEPLPLAGGTAMALARAAVTALPEQTRTALAMAAMVGTPLLSDLAAAGADPESWGPAEEAGLIEIDRDRVRFAHATYAAAARDDIPPARRRELHRLLGSVVADPDERARQLAAGVTEPDAEAADALAASGERQAARGLLAVAADLFLRASELTPAEDLREVDLRLAKACELAFEAGDHVTAADLARRLERAPTAVGRAEGAMHLGSLAWWDDQVDPRSSYEIALPALDGLPETEPAYGRLQLHLSVFAPRSDQSISHGLRAVESLRRAHEQGLAPTSEYVGAIFGIFGAEWSAGRPPRIDLLQEALEAEDEPSEYCGEVPAIYWSGIDQADRARERLAALQHRARVQGAEMWQVQLANQLAVTELLADRYDAADAAIEESLRIARAVDTGEEQQQWLQAMIALRRGDVDAADRISSAHPATDDSYSVRVWRHLHGLVAHARGDHATAAAAFADAARVMEADEILEASAARFEGEWAESLIALGDHEAAASVIDRLHRRHARMPRPWTGLCLARTRLMVRPGRVEDLESAIAAVPESVVPLERGRSLLALGLQWQRLGDADRAAQVLGQALAVFEQIGAVWWADRARVAATGRARTDPEEIRRALRNFNRPALLAESSLATGIGVQERVASVREVLTEAVDRTFGAGDAEQELRALLVAGYLDPDASHTRAMRRLALSRTTYYRRLAEATDRLIEAMADPNAG